MRGPRALRLAGECLPLLFAVLLTVHFVPSDWYRYRANLRKDAMRGPSYGVWRVESFTVADEKKPLLSPDMMSEMDVAPGEDRWRQMIVDAGGVVYLLLGNGQYDFVDGKEDARTGEMMMTDSGDKTWNARLHLVWTSGSGLTAQGEVNGNAVSIVFTKEDVGKNRPMDRPRWISDGNRW